MEELSQQLNQILSDPQSMRQIQEMIGSLGLGGNQNAAPVTPPAPQPAPTGITPEALQALTRLAPLLQQSRQEDDSIRLLRALRPLLGPARQQKLDEAIRILQMMRLLPLLKDSGLFSGLLSGLF